MIYADQNMRDFGDRERLLMSSERQSLYRMIFNFNEEELKIAKGSPYYEEVMSSDALQRVAKLDKLYL